MPVTIGPVEVSLSGTAVFVLLWAGQLTRGVPWGSESLLTLWLVTSRERSSGVVKLQMAGNKRSCYEGLD